MKFEQATKQQIYPGAYYTCVFATQLKIFTNFPFPDRKI